MTKFKSAGKNGYVRGYLQRSQNEGRFTICTVNGDLHTGSEIIAFDRDNKKFIDTEVVHNGKEYCYKNLKDDQGNCIPLYPGDWVLIPGELFEEVD